MGTSLPSIDLAYQLSHRWQRLDLPPLRAAAAVPTRAAAAPAGVAGYATLREINDRLKSMNNMKKITNTMKVVASTKLARASRAMEESRKYGETSQEVFEAAETKVPEVEEKKSLIIVCSSDRGLCGGIHSGLSRRIRKLFAEEGSSDLVVIA